MSKNLKELLNEENLFGSNGIKTEGEIDDLDLCVEDKNFLKEELEGMTTLMYLNDGMIKCDPDYE